MIDEGVTHSKRKASDHAGIEEPQTPQLSDQPRHFAALPLDIFVIIVQHLDTKDVISLSETCKHLHFITSARAVWHTLARHLIDSVIPFPPSPPLTTLSSSALRELVLRSMVLRKRWVGRPELSRRLTLAPSPARPRLLSTGLKFLLGRRYLFASLTPMEPVIGSDTDSPQHILQCMDFGEPGGKAEEGELPKVVAWKRFAYPVNFVINERKDNHAVVAASSADNGIMTAYILSLDTSFASQRLWTPSDSVAAGFLTLNTFVVRGIALLLQGDILASGGAEGNIWLYNIHSGELLCELLDARAPSLNETVKVVLLPGLVIAVGYASIKLFELPTFSRGKPQTIAPVATHVWRWRIDTVAAAPLMHSHAPTARPHINLWVRFGSWYPWPINMLHHYVLHPRHDGRGYALPPVLARYTYSALDLFAPSASALGPHGTALWTDSQTGEGEGQARAGLQRIAGKVLPSLLPADEEFMEHIGAEEAVGAGLGVDAATAMMGDRYDNSAALVLRVITGDHAQAHQLAMDEETGRVAVAWSDGGIAVWDYMPLVPET
ncbi:hypothetical protein BC834DRAFT_891874 [Gloeopeniophorella convolvens]|nr:hypothetical protein BC834DRAFT_891874 [Gloeopeniophorella convolvens]